MIHALDMLLRAYWRWLWEPRFSPFAVMFGVAVALLVRSLLS